MIALAFLGGFAIAISAMTILARAWLEDDRDRA